jgi:hypothetical protein
VPTVREAGRRTPPRGRAKYLLRVAFEWTVPQGAGTVTVLAFTVAVPAPPAEPANILPSTAAPVLMVMLVAARTFPLKMEVTSMVAEVPTCQKTLPAFAPPARMTWELVPVVRVEPILKMKTAFGVALSVERDVVSGSCSGD